MLGWYMGMCFFNGLELFLDCVVFLFLKYFRYDSVISCVFICFWNGCVVGWNILILINIRRLFWI